MSELFPTTEIVAATFLHGSADGALADFKKDPHSFLMATADVDISEEIEISFVDNNNKVMNLVLPYYSHVDDFLAKAVQDKELHDTSGGEIIGLILTALLGIGGAIGFSGFGASLAAGTAVVAGSAVAIAGATAGAATGVAAGARASEGKHINGKKK